MRQPILFTGDPTAALNPDARLVTGVEPDINDRSLRIYLGMRAAGIHTHVPEGEEAVEVEEVWESTCRHLWVTGIPNDVLCDCLNVELGDEDPASGR